MQMLSVADKEKVGQLGVFGPVPVRQGKALVADQLAEDRLVEIEVSAVPGEEVPAEVDLYPVGAMTGRPVAESVGAVAVVEVGLLAPAPRVRLSQSFQLVVRLGQPFDVVLAKVPDFLAEARFARRKVVGSGPLLGIRLGRRLHLTSRRVCGGSSQG